MRVASPNVTAFSGEPERAKRATRVRCNAMLGVVRMDGGGATWSRGGAGADFTPTLQPSPDSILLFSLTDAPGGRFGVAAV